MLPQPWQEGLCALARPGPWGRGLPLQGPRTSPEGTGGGKASPWSWLLQALPSLQGGAGDCSCGPFAHGPQTPAWSLNLGPLLPLGVRGGSRVQASTAKDARPDCCTPA